MKNRTKVRYRTFQLRSRGAAGPRGGGPVKTWPEVGKAEGFLTGSVCTCEGLISVVSTPIKPSSYSACSFEIYQVSACVHRSLSLQIESSRKRKSDISSSNGLIFELFNYRIFRTNFPTYNYRFLTCLELWMNTIHISSTFDRRRSLLITI